MNYDKFKDPYALEQDVREKRKWEDLFKITVKLYPQNAELLEALRAVRMAGAVLKKEKNGYAIRPIIDFWGERSLFKTVEVYEKWKDTYLMPFKEQIIKVMQAFTLAQEYEKTAAQLIGKTIKTPEGEGEVVGVELHEFIVKLNGEVKNFAIQECEPF